MGDRSAANESGGTIGVPSAGETDDVGMITGNIHGNIQSLARSGQSLLARAFRDLTEAVAAAAELSPEQRKEALENLADLSRSLASDLPPPPPREARPKGRLRNVSAPRPTPVGVERD